MYSFQTARAAYISIQSAYDVNSQAQGRRPIELAQLADNLLTSC